MTLRALVLADGDRPRAPILDETWPGWRDAIELVVAADGGVRLAGDLGMGVDLWIGDGDSLGTEGLEQLRRSGVPIVVAWQDKDESDTELAVLAAIDRGATDITILGGLGGRRIDHALANLGLLAHGALAEVSCRLLDEEVRITLVRAPGPDGWPSRLLLAGRVGGLVSLLPWGGPVEGIVTEGLRYPLRDETLEPGPARGLSNVQIGERASVSVRAGLLLVVESPASLST
ncbi:MAG TPA: thiamine diphosphokinase [Candidatus Limnocylindrales bacterium]